MIRILKPSQMVLLKTDTPKMSGQLTDLITAIAEGDLLRAMLKSTVNAHFFILHPDTNTYRHTTTTITTLM